MVGWRAALASACLGLVAAAGPAQAHTDLLASTPRADEVVPPGIGRVELVFSTDVVPAATDLVLEGPAGTTVGTGTPTVVGSTVEVPVGRLEEGAHTLAYRTTSVDGHLVAGSLDFTVAGMGATAVLQGGSGAVASPRSVPPPARRAPAGWQGPWFLAAGLVVCAALVLRGRGGAAGGRRRQARSSRGGAAARTSSSPRTSDSGS